MISRCLLLVGGAALMLVAVAGVVAWATGFSALKEGLLDGIPFFFNRAGGQIQIPGRIVGLAAVFAPLLGAVGGVWLFRLALENDNDRGN
jgi:hypothetical protein